MRSRTSFFEVQMEIEEIGINWGTFLRGFNQSFRFSGQHDSGPWEAFLKQALLKKMQLQDPDSFLIF